MFKLSQQPKTGKQRLLQTALKPVGSKVLWPDHNPHGNSQGLTS